MCDDGEIKTTNNCSCVKLAQHTTYDIRHSDFECRVARHPTFTTFRLRHSRHSRHSVHDIHDIQILNVAWLDIRHSRHSEFECRVARHTTFTTFRF